MSSPEDDNFDERRGHILNRKQRLRFGVIPWSTGEGFSSVLVDEDIISSVGKPSPPPAAALQECYRISNAPGKGLGMFATKDISPGDRILVEHPLIVVPKQILQFDIPPPVLYNLLIVAYEHTPAFEAFFSLANCYPLAEDTLPFEICVKALTGIMGADAIAAARPPGGFVCNVSAPPEDAIAADVKDANAIMQTNALEIKVLDPKWNASVSLLHRALCLDASRINHSCSPNASYGFDFESWSLSVTADCAISTGEEITIAYPDVKLLDSRESRLKTLNETRGFRCVCKTCDKPNEPKEIVESDKRREELRTWARTAPIMWRWFSDFSLKDDYVLHPHVRALFLMFKEGLYLTEREGHLVAIMDTYAALGERKKYIQWATKVQDYHKSKNNVRSAEDLEPFIATPESHPRWRLRIDAKEASGSKQKKKALPPENGHIPKAPTPTGPCGTVTQEDIERWLADTNWTANDLWSLGTSEHLKTRQYITRNIRVGNSECAALLDSITLSLIPVPPFKPYPRPVPKDAFKIAPTSNKGLAMFATKKFSFGGMILAECPSLILPSACPQTETPVHQYLFDRLDADERDALLSLANNKPPEVCSKYEGIVRTNGIRVHLPVEEGLPELSSAHVGVFLNISRCNHSCLPNAAWEWDLASWSMALMATRPIRAGEEITVAYIDNSESREARRKKLFKMYRFDCECERCHPAGG